jgi:hypothetical protein
MMWRLTVRNTKRLFRKSPYLAWPWLARKFGTGSENLTPVLPNAIAAMHYLPRRPKIAANDAACKTTRLAADLRL